MTTESLRDLEQDAWGGFLLAHERLWPALEIGLSELEITMAEYEVLSRLDVAGISGMRMTDLAEERQMSGGGLTRLTDRLQARGVVLRRRSALDARSLIVTLTEDGHNLLSQGRDRHCDDIRRLFLDKLGEEDLRFLVDVWAALDRTDQQGTSQLPGRDMTHGDPTHSTSTHVGQDAWAGFLTTHGRIWRELESGLAPLQLSMAEYDVLAQLAIAGRGGLRMSFLAERRLMSTGGFTRLADRLERRELIERRQSDRDRRILAAILTAAGRSMLRRAWRRHHADVRRLFLDRLDDDQLGRLAEIWVRLDPDNDMRRHICEVEHAAGAADRPDGRRASRSA